MDNTNIFLKTINLRTYMYLKSVKRCEIKKIFSKIIFHFSKKNYDA